jgi:hypothetical protein
VASEEHGHVALPKLYGAPAYARPPVKPVQQAERPFDPDELPLEAVRTDEEREAARQLAGRAYDGVAGSEPVAATNGRSVHLTGRPFRLRAIAGLFGDNEDSATR